MDVVLLILPVHQSQIQPITGDIDEIWCTTGISSRPNTIPAVHSRSCQAGPALWSFYASVCWWHSDIRLQFTVITRPAADAHVSPLLMQLPTGCRQIDCSLTPSRHLWCTSSNFLLHHSECAAITWHHLHLFETWAYIWTLTSVCVPKSQLSRRALEFWGSCVAFIVRCLTWLLLLW